MRTFLIVSLLVVTLVVCADSQGVKVTRELLQKLLRVTKEEHSKKGKTITADNLRERIGRVLNKVHNFKEEQKKETTPLDKLVSLLKKTLHKRDPENEVLVIPDSAPTVKKAVQITPEKKANDFDEPLEVLEGGELVEIASPEELYQYFILEIMSSENFCAKPVDQETLENVGAVMLDASNDIIKTLEDTAAALEAAEGEDEIIKAIEETFFGGFMSSSDKQERSSAESAAVLFRYTLYGTTEQTHCQMGDELFDWESGESKIISNRYDRMACIANGQVFFHLFMSDPFNPLFHSEEDAAAFEENRCNAAYTYLTDNTDIQMTPMVEKVVSDLECIANKLKAAISDEETAKRVLKNKITTRDVEPKDDPITQAIETIVKNTLEIMADMDQLVYALITSNPQADNGETEKRVLMKTIVNSLKRHYK